MWRGCECCDDQVEDGEAEAKPEAARNSRNKGDHRRGLRVGPVGGSLLFGIKEGLDVT